MGRRQSGPAKPVDTREESSPVHEAPALFQERDSWGATVAALVVLILIIFIAWVAVPSDQRSFEQLIEVLLSLADFVTTSGSNILALAIAMVAVAITTVTIVGIWRPEESTGERHWLVMRSAEVFMLGAIGFLAWLIAASVLSSFALSWPTPNVEGRTEPIDLVIVAASAITLWMVTTTLFGLWHRIVLNDSDRRQEDLLLIKRQKTHTKGLKDRARDTVIKLQGAKSVTQKRTFVTAVAWSVGWMGMAGIAAALLLNLGTETSGLSEQIYAMGRVCLGVFLLSGLLLLFTVIPYLWSSRLWQTEGSGWRKMLKLGGSLMLSSPLAMLVVGTVLFVIFSSEVIESVWTQIALAVLIIFPGPLSLFRPKRWSWRAVSAISALRQNATRLEHLETQEQRVLAAATAAEEQMRRAEKTENDLNMRSQQIVSLLEELVQKDAARDEPADTRTDLGRGQPQSLLNALRSFFGK